MKIAIHQPNFLPWLGYFYKMSQCDLFLFLDNVQYEKNGPINRVKIKTPQGEAWLTAAVKKRFPQKIHETELVNFHEQRLKMIKTIQLNYQKAKHFDFLFPELKEMLEKDWKYLSDLNKELIMLLKRKLDVKTTLDSASNYEVSGKSTDLLIQLCRAKNADTYMSGQGGRNYQDKEMFASAQIGLEYSDFTHPEYPQLWGQFVPGLSTIDLLLNCGPESKNFLAKRAP